MKKITFLLLSIAIIGIGCTLSPEKKAQKGIKEYLQKNLDDAKSYEGIEFSNLLNDYTKFEDTPIGKTLSSAKSDYLMDSLGIDDCLISNYPKEVYYSPFFRPRFCFS
ncbi:MAG: hypothetical protein M0Q51_16860 [Bacteroidales bacterium]|nr:hypothetical protein [Bacteroidales bacterium]